MLNYQLFEKEKCFFVVDPLPQLDLSTPFVRGELSLAIIALKIGFMKLEHCGFLEAGIPGNVFRYYQLYLDDPRARLCEDELRIL